MATSKIEEIKAQFMDRLNLKSLDENAKLTDLGLDSLDVVDMCLDLGDKYGINFETSDLEAFKTVKDLFDGIEKKL